MCTSLEFNPSRSLLVPILTKGFRHQVDFLLDGLGKLFKVNNRTVALACTVEMMNSEESTSLFSNAVYVSNLPPGCNETILSEHFGNIGSFKKDKRIISPKICVYRDKVINEYNGDAIIAFEDPHDAQSAVEWFNNTQFLGRMLSVTMAETKDSQNMSFEAVPALSPAPYQSVIDFGADSVLRRDYGGESAVDFGGGEDGNGAGSLLTVIGGRGRSGIDSKPWQQEGDWSCPNPSCSNVNFSFRGICNRCGTARPAGSLAAVGGGGPGCGRSRGRGLGDAGSRSGRGSGGPPGLFGPNDWNCPMCGNINWAKRTKCNICNTSKPGHNEGGARDGRAGGYKEFDEAEIEETRRRRRELEEDDGEMYDEFGNLKKKYRAKAREGDTQVAVALASGGMGKAGWDMEELGVVKQSKEKSKDQSGFSCSDNDGDADRGGRDYVQNVECARSSERVYGSGRDTRRGVGDWSIRESLRNQEQDRGEFVKERVGGGTWAWERVAARVHGGKDCVNESDNEQHGEGLRGRKRLRERDRVLD